MTNPVDQTQRRLEPAVCDILELVPDAILVVDQEGRILHVNELAERLFSYPQAHSWANCWKCWFLSGIGPCTSRCDAGT